MDELMASAPITWLGANTVTAAAGALSDPVKVTGGTFSAILTVLGSSPSGVTGNLSLMVSNDGISYLTAPGSVQSVDLLNGMSQVFGMSSAGYEWAAVQWQPGSLASGTLNLGTWSRPSGAPPVVGGFLPAVGTQITPSTALTFSVTDPNGLAFSALIVQVAYPSGQIEVAYNGLLTPLYANGSGVTAIANGFAFSLLRSGGWPATPTITVYAVDSAGAVDQ